MDRERVIYYAIVDAFSSRRCPAGVLRRTWRNGERRDEAFGRNLAWGHATTRFSADPAEDPVPELHEITEEEASWIVTRMLRAAASQD